MSARWLALGLRRPDGRRDRGQVLVLFALSIIVLFSFAGLAFDVGRFYSEKRFLQNAADAAALAAANALTRGATNAEAITEARAILTRNYLSDPTG
jgi:Flp pilus assembly protein TadG